MGSSSESIKGDYVAIEDLNAGLSKYFLFEMKVTNRGE